MNRSTVHDTSEQDLEGNQLMPVGEEGSSEMLIRLVAELEEAELLGCLGRADGRFLDKTIVM